MTSSDSDFTQIAEKLRETFQLYYQNNSTYSYMTADVMKVEQETGDISIETLKVVVLNPTAFDTLNKLLPLLHEPAARAILTDVMQETLDRLEGQDEPGRTTEQD